MNIVGYALVIALYGGFLGLLLRSVINGRKRDLIACAAITVLGGIVLALFGTALGLGIAGAAATIGLADALILAGSEYSRRSLLASVTIAPALREFALTNFKRLDFDGDDVISSGDLARVLADHSLTEAEQRLAERLAADLSYVGHVVDVISMAGPYPGAFAHVASYGANRQEIETYPERIRLSYERKFGSR